MILKLLKKIPSSTFLFNLPPKKKVIIFDDESINDLKYILSEKDYFLLKVRYNNVNEFIIHPLIFLKIILNFRGNIWSAYLISVIQIISPKIVITFSDNNLKFSEIAKLLNNKINFFAIQNGARYDFARFKHQFKMGIYQKDLSEDFFIPNLFCFGEYEIDDYKKKNISVGSFFPVGSLRLANYLNQNDNKTFDKILSQNYKYDICLISDGIEEEFDEKFKVEGAIDAVGKYVNFIIKYSRENNKKFICCLKRLNSGEKNIAKELNFYKKYLNKDDYDYLINNSTLNFTKSKYLSYEIMLKSELVISSFSTLLRENISLGRKSLSVNFMKNTLFDFPIDGVCKIEDCSFDDLEMRVNEILKMTTIEYFKELNMKSNYLMSFDKNNSTIAKIKKTINRYL